MEPVAAVVAIEALQALEPTLVVADNSTGYFGVRLNNPAAMHSPTPTRRG